MKPRLLTFLISLLALTAICQTDTNAPPSLWDILTTGSNYWAAPFGTYSIKDHSVGGGIAIGYRATEFINPLFRVDYFNHALYTASLDAQLQLPQKLLGKFPVVPFALAGIETPISGNASTDPMFGGGLAFKLQFAGSGKFWQNSDIVGDYELHTGLPEVQKRQLRFGWLFKF